MGSFGNFYKGDKKKKKKGEGSNIRVGSAPVFTPPEVISKKKDY